jgi:LPS-assembly protein
MLRILFLSLITALSLFSAPLTKEYELLAGEVHQEGDLLIAKEDVVIYSKSYAFRADKAHYNQKSADLELFGDVDIILNGKIITHLNHTIFNLKSKTFNTKNLFAYDAENQMWFNATDSNSKKEQYLLHHTTLSSCDREDPDWRIVFSKGVYHQDKEYISIYNPTFYAGNVPILYLPWFGFSTNKNRESGFLKPILGFENSENLFFVLPYYIANEANWDLEFDPQIRLNRGMGLYSTLRFVDTPYSHGEVNMGLFKEKKSYFEKNNLENRTHYGLELKYQNRSLLTQALKNHHYSDGLLIDINYLNDIDYINLDHKKDWASSKLVTSKANYLFYRDDDFLGIYAKYFIDTEKKSNDDTLQTLPSIQYHRFSQGVKIPNILYSLDYKFKNNYRKEGLNAKQHELSIPLTFHKSLFGDFLNFQASENFYYSRVNYTEGNATTQNADYFSNYHKFTLASDLTKRYPTYIHNLQLDLSLILPSFVHKNGYFADFLPFNLETKSLALKLNQYYYNMDGFNFLMHRLRQVYYDDALYYKYGDLENQLIYRISKDFVLHNTLFYSYEYDRIHKLQTGMNYKNNHFDISMNHTYEYKVDKKKTNFVTAKLNKRIDAHYDIFASLDYDFEDSFTKEWTVGWRMKKRCWDYRFRYKESVTPSLTSAGTESIIKRGILLFVRFSPFGGMAYNFNQNSSLELTN